MRNGMQRNDKETTATGFISGKASFVNAASPETLVHALRMKGYLNFWELRKFGSREGKNEKFKIFSFVCSAYVRCSFGSDWV